MKYKYFIYIYVSEYNLASVRWIAQTSQLPALNHTTQSNILQVYNEKHITYASVLNIFIENNNLHK